MRSAPIEPLRHLAFGFGERPPRFAPPSKRRMTHLDPKPTPMAAAAHNAFDLRERIGDALIGAAYRYPMPDVFLYPLTDLLVVFFQSPVVISFWRGDELIFSSLRDAFHFGRYQHRLVALTPRRYPIRISREYGVAVHELVDSELARNDALRRRLEDLLDGLTKSKTSAALIFRETVIKTLASIKDGPDLTVTEFRRPHRDVLDVSYARVLESLEPMRSVLDTALADFGESPFLNNPEARCVKVFSVFRSVIHGGLRYQNSFNYTAGLVLSKSQRRLLSDQIILRGISNVGDRDLLDVLETPLGDHSRSLADSVFCSGIVDFGRRVAQPDWDVAVGPDDEKRKVAEQLIYDLFGPERTVFYVPIHVGGTPWVAVFTPTHHDISAKNPNWDHNYRFYRDVIGTIGDRIRSGARQVYLDLVRKRFLEGLDQAGVNKRVIAALISKEWAILAQVFPFPRLRLAAVADPIAHSSDGDGKEALLPIEGIGEFRATVTENPFFPPQVQYGLLERDSIFAMLGSAAESYNRGAEISRTGTVAVMPHLLKVPISHLKTLLNDNLPDGGLKERMAGILGEMEALERFGGAVLRKDEGERMRATQGESVPASEFFKWVATEVTRCHVAQSSRNFSAETAGVLEALIRARALKIDIQVPTTAVEGRIHFYRSQVIAVIHEVLANSLGKQPETPEHMCLEVSLAISAPMMSVNFVVKNATTETGTNLRDAVERLRLGGAGRVGTAIINLACRACAYSDPRWNEYDPGDGSPGSVTATVQIGRFVKGGRS
jgi:hypothetical protein